MAQRADLLRELLAANLPLEDVGRQLASFGWDSEELVELRADHVVRVLLRFVRGDLRAAEVRTWADLVELRDDIGFEPTHREALKAAIFQLATPEAEGPLAEARARELIAALTSSDRDAATGQ